MARRKRKTWLTKSGVEVYSRGRLEAALRVALGLYVNPDAESATGYAQYRGAYDILEGE